MTTETIDYEIPADPLPYPRKPEDDPVIAKLKAENNRLQTSLNWARSFDRERRSQLAKWGR